MSERITDINLAQIRGYGEAMMLHPTDESDPPVGEAVINLCNEVTTLRAILRDMVDDMIFSIAPSKSTIAKARAALGEEPRP